MTRDDIIRMAQETGCLNVADYGRKSYEFQPEELERFAALVAAAEREACAVIAFNAKTYIEAANAIRARREQ